MTSWLAFGSVWIGLASLGLSLAMLLHRPLMTDLAIVAVLWFAAPAAICFGGLTLWAHRSEGDEEAGIAAQRLQSKVGIAMAIGATVIVYVLIIFSHKLEPV